MVDVSTVRVEIPIRARPTVLHVTEAMGGGLEAALLDFVRSTPQFRHVVLFTRRGEFGTADRLESYADAVIDAGRGIKALLLRYRATIRNVRPDVIHLHSAWAGLLGRTVPAAPGVPVVYSPHSFFFDRRDVPAPVRWLAHAVERVLVSRTAAVAAVSPLEAQVARMMKSVAHYVPNVVRLPEHLHWMGDRTGEEPREVVAIGRLAEQKGPEFFREVVRLVRLRLPDVRWTWIGGGDERLEATLRAEGVQVTGWMPRAQCLDRLSTAAVYLHTAAWEGNPITLLEAAALGVPVVARSIGALDSLGFDPSIRTAEAVADRLVDVLQGTIASAASPAPDAEMQAQALSRVYESVLAVQPVPATVGTVVPVVR